METLDLRETWRQGPVLGCWSALAQPFAAELCAAPGIDYICVDQQHGVVDYTDLLTILPAIERHGKVGLTRVPANDASLIARSLDAGASGVVVPMVNTAAEAARAVAACRYAPDGIRSFGPLRAALTHGTAHAGALSRVLCLVMVETREGVANLEQIARTPGLDGIYVGPADLGLSLGYEPTLDPVEDEHIAAIERVATVCAANGLIAGIQCSGGAAAREWVQRGYPMVTVAKDTALLQAGAKESVRAFHDHSTTVTRSVYT